MPESELAALPPLEERPLVTFVLFAYNQEKYIRKAIEGVFAQTYEQLEIILSDDCSTDRTFEIMEEMAAGYQGPHRVRSIKNDTNLGVARHVIKRGREARGEIVVVAAGDDISIPMRTAKLILPMLRSPQVFATDSLVDIVDEVGNIVSLNAMRPLHLKAPRLFLIGAEGHGEPLQGCAAAYRKEVFDLPLPSLEMSFAEDLLLSFYIRICGHKTVRVNQSLLKYRRHANALANRKPGPVRVEDEESESVKSATQMKQMLCTFEFIAEAVGRKEMFDQTSLQREMRSIEIITSWKNMGILKRLNLLVTEIVGWRSLLAKWMVFRLLGTYPRYQPKVFLSQFQGRHTS